MPLDAARPLDKTAAITDAFAEIGRVNGTMPPRSRNAKDKLAWEYWTASLLNRLAEARRDKAKRAAVAGDVLPDHTAHPLPVGTVETVYTGALVTIGMKVVEQADRLDVAGFVADLEKSGVASRLLKRLVKRHTRSFPGAHVFTASLT
jgi:hypothetical protein